MDRSVRDYELLIDRLCGYAYRRLLDPDLSLIHADPEMGRYYDTLRETFSELVSALRGERQRVAYRHFGRD